MLPPSEWRSQGPDPLMRFTWQAKVGIGLFFELLDEAVSVKIRNRDASDTEAPWSLVACLSWGRCPTSMGCAPTGWLARVGSARG